ncbi:hypothetical protein Tco_0964859, partial [Tanacetum coccineum]
MARIQPADQNSDDEPSYESAFISEVQSSSINENVEQMYPTHTKIINSTIDDDQINRNIQFDFVKGNVNSGSVEKDTHVHDLCALETLARNAYEEAAKQQRFAQKVQQQNMTLTSQIEMYKEGNRYKTLIKRTDNTKMEYKKLFDSIKKTRSQTQKEMDELITHVSEKTYAYGPICAENQNLLDTIFELKARMKNGKNGMNATSSEEAVYFRKNKQTDNTFAKVVSNKENVIDVAVANASKAKNLLRVS